MPRPAFFNKKSRLFGLTPVNICCVLSGTSFKCISPSITLIPHYFGPTFRQPSSLDWKEILRSHFCTVGFHWHNFLFLVSSQSQVVPFAVPDLFCLMSGFEQDAQLWGPENTNKSYSANVSLETNRWLLDIQLFKYYWCGNKNQLNCSWMV